MAEENERVAVYFCEFDAIELECPVQRLGGIPAAQGHPSIDGHRIVWEDARDGVTQIRGLELPRLLAPETLSVKAGGPFRFAIWVDPGTAGGTVIEIEGITGLTPPQAQLEVRLHLHGFPGLVRVHGRMPLGGTAEATSWWLRMTNAAGVFTQRRIELTVRDGNERRRRPLVDP